MKNDLVSVIIAIKNGERFIQQAIESVLAQTYSPLEILIIDGNSTDKTLAIAGKFEKAKIFNQTGKGIGNAYNTGIAIAQGKYIAFLSADDYWTGDKISEQISALKESSSTGFAVCYAEFFLENPNFIPPGFRTELLKAPRVAYIMETLCAHRSVFEKVGLFNERLTTAEDVDWFARARDLQIESVVLPKVLLKKRIHHQNLHLESEQNNRELLRAVRHSIERKRLGKTELQ